MNLEAALKVLTQAGVNFVVVGGHAALVHGSAHLTFDLDICYERTPANIQRLVASLQPYRPHLRGAPPDLPFIFDAKTVSQGLNFTLQTDFGAIDLLGHLDGVGGFSDIIGDATVRPVLGGMYPVISLDALICCKRTAGRPKDLTVLHELEAIKEMRELIKSPDESDESSPDKDEDKS
jgi:hypothetical protein